MHHGNQSSVLAFIGIGSNMGDREQLLKEAISHLHNPSAIDVVCCSSMYETEPVGYIEQAAFLNMVVAVRTTCSAHELFECMVNIEQKLGRARNIRWGPRTIDLDLLMYGDEELTSEDLIIPHPRMHERGFVLIPFQEVIVKEKLSRFESVNSSLEKLDGKGGVILWKKVNWDNELGLFAN